MPVYHRAFSMARQAMFIPWFSQPSGTPRRRALSPSSTTYPHVFFGRFSSVFHRPQPTTSESMELQQHRTPSTSSHPGPRAIEVAPVRDKQALFVARRPEQASDKLKRIKNPTWWTRCILFICCASAPSPDTATDDR
ncbi:hypothetical protein AZE42_11472 [Rhizopogon vesiculosus]|uniref:Uncharacterized protein n=1 Tax=Rhizopogon vesiculosus TaxID=180088 RepID=A0A1J8PLJ6_9AGAM|nr:hypothetical protein AZE42_11472 [Rhizopogon vesiculosus]